MKYLTKKQQEFNLAMKKYHDNKRYRYIYLLVSVLNVSMQLYLFLVLFTLHFEWYAFVIIFIFSYFITDFINGYVHLYMDNNESYNSLVGPFIASFHLHHRTPDYRKFSILKIYFNESGPKFWLLLFLIFTIILSFISSNDYLLLGLILVGILSSIAEVSHFLCHSSTSKVVLFLQKIRLLLSMEHHRNHHSKDNQSYAFLNGMSDFLLDKIAKKFYGGYQEHSDLHSQGYEGEDTKNRGKR
jgi:sterol desaturase/sphingolipid hydroxylase (fatty acid hydroxylase superfamily)